MQVFTHIPVQFNPDALSSKLHIGEHGQDAADLHRLIELVAPVVNPKALFATCDVQARTENSVQVGGAVFASRALRVNLDKAERVFPFIVTCGRELDEIGVPREDILLGYWLDELKSVALDAAHKHLFSHLKRHCEQTCITSMNPGAGDRDVWPIEQQRQLFSLLGDTEKSVGVRLTDSCLMVPNKSISGIIFPAETEFEVCRLCHRKGCPGRTAPFDGTLYDRIHTGDEGQKSLDG